MNNKTLAELMADPIAAEEYRAAALRGLGVLRDSLNRLSGFQLDRETLGKIEEQGVEITSVLQLAGTVLSSFLSLSPEAQGMQVLTGVMAELKTAQEAMGVEKLMSEISDLLGEDMNIQHTRTGRIGRAYSDDLPS